MHYRIELAFLCHDHRLRGTVEWDVDEHALWPLTLSQLLDEMRRLILHRYPDIDDAIDHIELLTLRIEKLSASATTELQGHCTLQKPAFEDVLVALA